MAFCKRFITLGILVFLMPVVAWPVQPLLADRRIYLKHTRMCLSGDDCDTHLLRLMMSLLSKRGRIDVSSREMRLTVRDERQRVTRVLKLAKCYDNSRLPLDERKKKCA